MRIVVEEQGERERAEYGKETIKLLAKELTEEFGRGYSLSNLKNMRKFFVEYSFLKDEKSQTLSGFFDKRQIGRTVSDQSSLGKSQTLSRKLDIAQIWQTLSAPRGFLSSSKERRNHEWTRINTNWVKPRNTLKTQKWNQQRMQTSVD